MPRNKQPEWIIFINNSNFTWNVNDLYYSIRIFILIFIYNYIFNIYIQFHLFNLIYCGIRVKHEYRLFAFHLRLISSIVDLKKNIIQFYMRDWLVELDHGRKRSLPFRSLAWSPCAFHTLFGTAVFWSKTRRSQRYGNNIVWFE